MLDEFPRYPLDVLGFYLGAFGLAAVAVLLTDVRPFDDFVTRVVTHLLHHPLVRIEFVVGGMATSAFNRSDTDAVGKFDND